MSNPTHTTTSLESALMRYTFTVPPTRDVGSYSGSCCCGYMGSYRKDALRDYNSARAHDGLPPIFRMPAGTKYNKATGERS